MANRRGKSGSNDRFSFGGALKSLWTVTAAMKLRHLLLGRKAVTNLDNILKGRDITLLTSTVCQSYGFSISHVWMWELNHKEGWVPKNWCFPIGWWRRLLRVPWTARRSNQSILKEISPEYSLEGLMLKLQYFCHRCKEPTHWKIPWCWDRLKGKGEVGIRE